MNFLDKTQGNTEYLQHYDHYSQERYVRVIWFRQETSSSDGMTRSKSPIERYPRVE